MLISDLDVPEGFVTEVEVGRGVLEELEVEVGRGVVEEDEDGVVGVVLPRLAVVPVFPAAVGVGVGVAPPRVRST